MRLNKLLLLIFVLSTNVISSTTRESVFGGPNGHHPYLRKTVSSKGYVRTARDYNWAINYHRPVNDSINIVAVRVEFNKGVRDTLLSTTGNGLFGINRNGGGKEEYEFYQDDTSYIFDRLPHDSLYFAQQLNAVAGYYKKVSRDRLTLTYKIYPSGKYAAYAVDSTMLYYSPGGKKKKESWDEYYYRKTLRYMFFIKDALKVCSESKESPFTGIRFEKSDNTFRDSLNRKTVFLIFHAGASGLTDGIKEGYADTPADIVDGFVTADWFKDYKDTLDLEQNGVLVQGNGEKLLIDELMVCSETSNQDGLNWGIQGILVNQIARQIGIPDLYSTFSGTVGIGAFCIMDFAGYSAGSGFVPTYPSAWVRAFMGWDQPRIVPAGAGTGVSVNVKALTSVLDNPQSSSNDTTIVMIPINDHEYYLIENRQRNLSGTTAFFNYDSTDDEIGVIKQYPFNINLKKYLTSITDSSKVVRDVRNNDISLPASGILVWHIDEKVIREKIKNNMINADSTYRGVRLVEADGADDIGVKFFNYLNQDAYDYGTGEDVFPHRRTTSITAEKYSSYDVTGFGPFTFPSTRTNDGGHSYLSLHFKGMTPQLQTEKTALYRGSDLVYVENFSDSVFTITARMDYTPQYWPKTMIPEPYHEPVLCDLDKQTPGKELVAISKSGRINIFNNSSDLYQTSYAFDSASISKSDLLGNTGGNVATYFFSDSLAGICAMPSVCNNTVMIPSIYNKIFILSSVSQSAAPSISEIPLTSQPSTYLCVAHDSTWAIGCTGGTVIFGRSSDTISSVKLKSDSSVCAIAAIKESGLYAVIQTDGALSICGPDGNIIEKVEKIKGIGPYTLVTGDLDNDSTSEIVVCDIKHGLWLCRSDLSISQDWSETAVDWSSYYTIDENNKQIENRAKFPDNPAPPALADFNGDGRLDIIIGGTNGLYAFNYKGVLLNGWPAFLDKKYWYQKGSVVSSPAIVTGKDNKPLALFSTATGEKITFGISKVIRAERNAGKLWYTAESGQIDSIWDLRPTEIDTILNYSDSLILPYALPGGYIDAFAAKGTTTKPKRPMTTKEGVLQSSWPLSAGSPLQTSPMIADMDLNGTLDLIAITKSGWAYRWEIDGEFLLDTLFWPMPGFDQGRSFAYGSYQPIQKNVQTEPIRFYNFPNPTDGADKTIFRYAFSGNATKVRLDIFSITGINVYSKTTMGSAPSELTGSYPDWNEHIVSLKKFGPGVYRCRMEATIHNKKHVRYWKMAVVK